MLKSIPRAFFAAVTLVAGAALWLGLRPAPETAIQWSVASGYYWMAALSLFFVLSLWLWVRRNRGVLARRWRIAVGALLWVGLVGWLFLPLEPRVDKVYMDEPLQVGVSQGMHLDRLVQYPVRAHVIEGEVTVLNSAFDKRPYLYPFWVSILHDATGYRTTNAFWVNHLLYGALLWMVFVVIWMQTRSVLAAGLGSLLLGSVPELVRLANGAGIDVLNLAGVALFAFLSLIYLRRPDGVSGLLLVAGSLLLCYGRYESVLIVFPVAFLLLWGSWRTGQWTWHWAMLLAPVLLIPYLWRHATFIADPVQLQLFSHPGKEYIYSLAYIPQHLLHAGRYFFSLDSALPNGIVLPLLGIPAALFLLWRLYFRSEDNESRRRASREWGVILSVLALFHFGLLMAYFFGELDDLRVSRLSLPHYLPLALWAGMAIGCVRSSRLRIGFAVAVLLAVGMVERPKIAAHVYSREYYPSAQREILREWRQAWKHRLDAPAPLLISLEPFVPISEGIPALSVPRANQHLPQLARFIEEGRSPVYAFELVVRDRPEDSWVPGSPVEDPALQQFLDSRIERREVRLYEVTPLRAYRLSRVEGVTGVEPWVAPPEARVYSERVQALIALP